MITRTVAAQPTSGCRALRKVPLALTSRDGLLRSEEATAITSGADRSFHHVRGPVPAQMRVQVHDPELPVADARPPFPPSLLAVSSDAF
jgi:hypothetical protein